MFTWGNAEYYRLGNGDKWRFVFTPQRVHPPDGELAESASCGYYHTLVLTRSKRLFGFGAYIFGGPNLKEAELPTELTFFRGHTILAFQAGEGSSYVRTPAGVFVFGENRCGQLGSSSFWHRVIKTARRTR